MVVLFFFNFFTTELPTTNLFNPIWVKNINYCCEQFVCQLCLESHWVMCMLNKNLKH